MRLKGEEYSKRLQKFSDSAIKLISEMMCCTEDIYQSCRDITTDSELTEEQVVEKLLELKASYLTTMEASTDDNLEKSYQLIQENPKITKEEFLATMGIVEDEF